MRPVEIQTLHEYIYWTVNLLLDKAEELTPEEFNAPNKFPYGSVRGTFAHELAALNIWRLRIVEKSSPTSLPTFSDLASVADLRAAYGETEASWRAFLDTLDEETLAGNVSWKNTRGISASLPLWQVLTHLVNHSTQHNSEIAQMLTEFDHSPGDIDLLYWAIRFGKQVQG